jgi:serine/threonine-protein kinase PknG
MTCDRPGCTGTIEADGYCNVCGHKSNQRPVAVVTSAARIGAGGGVAGPGVAAPPAPPAGVAAPPAPPAGVAAPTGPPRSTATGTTAAAAASTTTGRGIGIGGTRSNGRPSSRGNLGAGLVEVPPVGYRDPASVLMLDPHVSESKRHCASCDAPVGRSRDGRPGRADGFCPQCGAAYSFTPKLAAGDLVAGQYEVAGCLAHGGLGWVYLARDRNVDNRWVVLKGLLDSGDESAMAAAIVERRFLAEVEHPNIVKIYNFVQHEGDGYIVMEYVGGKSLKELRRNELGTPTPMPVAQAIAYILEALPALAHLHARGLLYCDFKPDNVIQTEEQVKIIDLGGVRGINDESSDLYGTVGYQAPEVPESGPSVASDLYTVVRTLAVLVFDFRGFQDPHRYRDCLPPSAEVPAFACHPGLYRFLVKGADPQPSRRFQSAGEMADQLVGVLRQVVARDGGEPDPAPSRLFTAELAVDTERPTWRYLPIPAMDRDDPSAGVLTSLTAAPPAQLLAALEGATPSADVSFQRARAYLELGDWQKAADAIVSQIAVDGEDWRVWWWEGVLDLVDGDWNAASVVFEKVAAELPGELAPLLAKAIAEESAGNDKGAAELYDLVSATDPGYASAAFGLARTRRTTDDRDGAADALRRVPAKSSAYQAAQAALCSLLSEPGVSGPPVVEDLVAAAVALARITGDPRLRAALTRDILTAGLSVVENDPGAGSGIELTGVALDEQSIRLALERVCRTLAKLSSTDIERFALVDQANAYRRRTLL